MFGFRLEEEQKENRGKIEEMKNEMKSKDELVERLRAENDVLNK